MIVHRARGAAYDLTREREYNWWKAKRGRKLNGPVHHCSREELAEFAAEQGLELSPNATFRVMRHA
jgi:hypothetical protein